MAVHMHTLCHGLAYENVAYSCRRLNGASLRLPASIRSVVVEDCVIESLRPFVSYPALQGT